MIYIEAPEYYDFDGTDTTVFMAGGITGCPDWQAEMVRLLADTDLVLFNPRRFDFPDDIRQASEETQVQIQWEHQYLKRADKILFWFPYSETSVCPISLFELGFWLHSDKPLAVGVEPGYAREADVHIQVPLQRPEIQVVSSLEDLAKEISK